MATARVGDIDVHYTERGDGSPLVLVHGGLATAEIMWNEEYVAVLADHHHVFMPDSRGHGRTTNPANALAYPQMADDVAGFCAALQLAGPVVIGYSDGAQIAIELALRHPNLARALVLGGVVVTPSPAYFAMLATMGITSAGADVDAMRARFGDALFEMMVKKPHASWRTLLDQIARLWMTLPSYTDAELAKITAPSLVICGDRDRSSLDDAVRLSRTLPAAELAVVPCAEHGAASKPLFWTNVLDFLKRH